MTIQITEQEKGVIKSHVSNWRFHKNRFSELVRENNNQDMEIIFSILVEITRKTINFIRHETTNGSMLDWMPTDRIMDSNTLSNAYMESIEKWIK